MDWKKELIFFDDAWAEVPAKYLFLEVPPQSKQSTRFGRKRAYTDKEKGAYVAELHLRAKINYSGPLLKGFVRLTVIYCFPWRKKDKDIRSLVWIPKDSAPDVDNLTKPVKDALQGVVYANDSSVVEERARKVWCGLTGIAIQIEEASRNLQGFVQ